MKRTFLSTLLLMMVMTQATWAIDKSDVQRVLIHSAIGAGTGAVVGGVSDRSTAWQGAAVGAGSGVATGVIDSVDALNDKPLVRSTAKGAVTGLGASTITERSKLGGAAVGAGAGAGVHFLRRLFD